MRKATKWRISGHPLVRTILYAICVTTSIGYIQPLGTMHSQSSPRKPDLVAGVAPKLTFRGRGDFYLHQLSDKYLENDLIAVQLESNNAGQPSRLCAVQPDGEGVVPLCRRQDDVETDLFADPREYANRLWLQVDDTHVTHAYGEGFYGQRPVPSLGGGPGYGAEANSVWSCDASVLACVDQDGVELPVLDMGIAHGEKARGGMI